MSRPSKKESSEAQPRNQPSDFVLDFLYHDSRRIQSLLAQFMGPGHTQQSRFMQAVGRTKTSRYSASVSSEIPIIARGSGNLERTSAKEGKSSVEETYDPFWANARRFLDFAESAELFTPILQARMGDLIKFTGSFVVVDLGLLQKICQVPELKDLFRDTEVRKAVQANEDIKTLPPGRRKSQESDIKKKAADAFNQHAELLMLIPSGIHCHMIGSEFTLWSIFNEADLVPTSSTLLLKHGVLIGDNWTVVGILDALPGRLELTEENLQNLMPVVGQVGAMTIKIAQYTRNLFGKPQASGSVTPLLVYRQVGSTRVT